MDPRGVPAGGCQPSAQQDRARCLGARGVLLRGARPVAHPDRGTPSARQMSCNPSGPPGPAVQGAQHPTGQLLASGSGRVLAGRVPGAQRSAGVLQVPRAPCCARWRGCGGRKVIWPHRSSGGSWLRVELVDHMVSLRCSVTRQAGVQRDHDVGRGPRASRRPPAPWLSARGVRWAAVSAGDACPASVAVVARVRANAATAFSMIVMTNPFWPGPPVCGADSDNSSNSWSLR